MVIEEKRHRAHPVNSFARVASLALALPAVALFAISGVLPAYGGVVQLVSLALLVAALFLAYKFVFSTYTYVITDPGNGTPCLLVEQQQGRRSTLAFHVPLHAVLRVQEMGKMPQGRAYLYTARLRGGQYQYVVCRVDGVEQILKIEADADFIAALAAAAAEARQRRADE